jgi:uncharacterized repeat protein (TIGR02543 family)
MAHNSTNVITLRDIMRMSPENRKSLYRVSGVDGDTPKHIDKVTIDNNTFTDYTAFTFLMEKSYVKSPVRSGSGSIENLDSYASFLTPHLKIDFSVISIDSYRTLMKLLRSKNEFTVTCYDIVNDIDVTHKMYFATEQMPKLWSIAQALNGDEWVELLGVQNYTIELIGTNASFDTANVTYHYNPPAITGASDYTIGTKDISVGAEFVVGDVADDIIDNAPSGFKFKQWSDKPDGEGAIYINGYAYSLSNSIALYAIWENVDSYTLNYNYGLSAPDINDDLTYKYSKTVVYEQPIGALPQITIPTVEYNNGEYTPYVNGRWYKTPIKAPNSEPLTETDKYWLTQDSTIYLIFDVTYYKVSYYIDGTLFSEAEIQYKNNVLLPKLYKASHTFDGWYIDANYTEEFSGTMPPININLYARWVLKE